MSGDAPACADAPQPRDFRKELESLINSHSKENGSNTPDFILADYLAGCLEVWDRTVTAREHWYGRGRQNAVIFVPDGNQDG